MNNRILTGNKDIAGTIYREAIENFISEEKKELLDFFKKQIYLRIQQKKPLINFFHLQKDLA